jgi:hypothetical protein
MRRIDKFARTERQNDEARPPSIYSTVLCR